MCIIRYEWSLLLKLITTLKGKYEINFQLFRFLEPHFVLSSFHTFNADSHVHYNRQNSDIQGVPGGNVNILGGHSIGHSKQKSVYVHVSYSERFPR